MQIHICTTQTLIQKLFTPYLITWCKRSGGEKNLFYIGQGASGTVYLGLNLTNGGLMGAKQLERHDVNSSELSALENEISMLKVCTT